MSSQSPISCPSTKPSLLSIWKKISYCWAGRGKNTSHSKQSLPLPVRASQVAQWSRICIIPSQGSNLCLLHWQADSLPPSHLGSPGPLWVLDKSCKNTCNTVSLTCYKDSCKWVMVNTLTWFLKNVSNCKISIHTEYCYYNLGIVNYYLSPGKELKKKKSNRINYMLSKST